MFGAATAGEVAIAVRTGARTRHSARSHDARSAPASSTILADRERTIEAALALVR